MNDAPQTISVDQIRRILWRRRWVVIQLVLIGSVAGALAALAASPDKTATATVLVGVGAGSDRAGVSADVAARLVRTRAIAERVREELRDRRPVGALLDAVSVQPDQSGAYIDITARDSASGRAAAQLANAFAEQFIGMRGETSRARAQRAIAALERDLADLPRDSRERSSVASELAGLRTASVLGSFDAELIDPAVPAAAQDEASPVRWGAAGAALGLLLGLVLAFSLAALDPRVRRVAELRRLVDAPQLAALPRLRSRRGRGPRVMAGSREPFDHLRTGLLALTGPDALRRVVVTSPSERSEGGATVAAHLAVSLARLRLRVCIVDADLRRPALGAQFGLDDASAGFADAIRGTPIGQIVQSFSVPAENPTNGSRPAEPVQLSVVTAGGAGADDAAELLSAARVEPIFAELGGDHDVLIVQCAPLLAVSDTLALLALTSGAILVVRHSRTQRGDVARAAQVIDNAGGSLLSVVVAGVPKSELAAEGYGPWPSSSAAASTTVAP